MKWLKIPEDGTGEMGISRDVAQRVLEEFDDRGDGYLSLPRLMAWLEREPTRDSFAEAELKQALLQVCSTLDSATRMCACCHFVSMLRLF